MAKKKKGFELEIDAKTAKKFVKMLKDEGLMRAGFVIHESNNTVVSFQEKHPDFELDMDGKTTKKFVKMMKDEGLMRAGFVIHESNNKTLTLDDDIKPTKPKKSTKPKK